MKVLFLDEEQVYVAYDLQQEDQEEAGCFVGRSPRPFADIDSAAECLTVEDVASYAFAGEKYQVVSQGLDAGAMLIFRLVAPGKEDLFLHIYNAQDGSCDHKIVMGKGDLITDETFI